MEGNKLVYYAIVSGLTTLLSILAVSTYFWMHINGTSDIGAFDSSNQGKREYMTKCTSVMSQMECGYLHSLQVSAVLTIIFGGTNTILYLAPPRAFATFPTFVAVSGSMCQLAFAIITAVLFMYFKNTYYDDDGVNREYTTPDADDVSYNWSYWLWVAATCLTLPIVVHGYYDLYRMNINGLQRSQKG